MRTQKNLWRWLVDKRSIRVLIGPSGLAILACVYDNRCTDGMSLVVDSNSIKPVTFVKLVPLPEQTLARKKEKMPTDTKEKEEIFRVCLPGT